MQLFKFPVYISWLAIFWFIRLPEVTLDTLDYICFERYIDDVMYTGVRVC